MMKIIILDDLGSAAVCRYPSVSANKPDSDYLKNGLKESNLAPCGGVSTATGHWERSQRKVRWTLKHSWGMGSEDAEAACSPGQYCLGAVGV